MYFPILRGRQFELLALRECVSKGILSNQIIPILEPVKVSSTYTTTVDSFIKAGRSIAVIRNPQVGSWVKDLKKESNANIRERASAQLNDANVISSYYVTSKLAACIEHAANSGHSIDSLLLLCNDPEYVRNYEEVIGSNSTTNPGGYNLAVFNPDLFECTSVSVFDIEKLQYTSTKIS